MLRMVGQEARNNLGAQCRSQVPCQERTTQPQTSCGMRKINSFGSASVVRVLLYAAEYNPDLSTQHTACL